MKHETQPIRSGALRGNAAFLRAAGMAGAIRRPRPVEFPVFSFVVRRAGGLVAIDTGLREGVRVPWAMRRVAPQPTTRVEGGMPGAMRAAGLDPRDVTDVVLTHLDWDHAGGVAAFRHATIWVHEPEYAFAKTLRGALRYQPARWPDGFTPRLYRLDDGPFGPFGSSKRLWAGWTLVPLPGHSVAQVGVVVDGATRDSPRLFFSGDHVLSARWLEEDLAAGRQTGLGQFFPEEARATTRRLTQFLDASPTILLPSHDDEVHRRLDESICTHSSGEGDHALT